MSPIVPPGDDRDRRRELFPEELLPYFDDRFIGSCDLVEEYVFRLTVGVAREAGLEGPLRLGGTAETIAARAGLDPIVGPPLTDWILRSLSERGIVRRDGEPARFRLESGLEERDADEVVRAQEVHDASALPSFRLAAMAAESYPSVMRGEITGEAALFTADRIGAWSEYFSNENPPYAISNRIGARAMAARFPHPRGAVLELGGGFGSGAAAVLERFVADGALDRVETYRFTEFSPLFLRRAQRAIAARPEAAGRVDFARLDMNRPFEEAAVEPGSLSVVYGVNTLHVARDLAFTLGEIRKSLAPGGLVLASECVRPFPGRTVYVEFVFLLLEAFRSPACHPAWRPNGGFLTPEQWTEAFAATGFSEPFVWPDARTIVRHYPSFVAAVVGASRP